MSYNLTLEEQPTDRNAAYPLNTDLMTGFNTAVRNNQSRMALEYLVEIIKKMNDYLFTLDADRDKCDPRRSGNKPEGQEKEQTELPPSRSKAGRPSKAAVEGVEEAQ